MISVGCCSDTAAAVFREKIHETLVFCSLKTHFLFRESGTQGRPVLCIQLLRMYCVLHNQASALTQNKFEMIFVICFKARLSFHSNLYRYRYQISFSASFLLIFLKSRVTQGPLRPCQAIISDRLKIKFGLSGTMDSN